MKGQILSRIQSYQNIPIHMPINPHRISTNQSSKLINEAKFLKYTSNMAKQSPSESIKVSSPSPKVKSHRFLFSQHGASSTTKKMNSTVNKDVKRSLNFDLVAVRKNSQRNIKGQNKQSEKSLVSKNILKHISGQGQNQPNSQNIQNEFKEWNSISKYPKFIQNAVKLNKEMKEPSTIGLGRRKQLMRIYSKIDLNKEKVGIGSQQNIRTLEINEENSKDPQIHQIRHNLMMKTVNVFNKPCPYLNLGKKFTIKSPHKKAPTKSLSRIQTVGVTQKQQVSIQLSVEEGRQGGGDKGEVMELSMQFGCSEIKQKQIENDSSFLESAQKNLISEMEGHEREESKKKKWRKLPCDFLKL